MKLPGSNQRLGGWGEKLVSHYLEQKGYQLLARNFRTPFGEIDLIFQQAETTVFVEVKTRSGLGFGFPEEAITATKRLHLLDAIQSYWQTSQRPEGTWRVDVVAVIGRPGRVGPEIEHFENAIV